jgi:hypothetical protein
LLTPDLVVVREETLDNFDAFDCEKRSSSSSNSSPNKSDVFCGTDFCADFEVDNFFVAATVKKSCEPRDIQLKRCIPTWKIRKYQKNLKVEEKSGNFINDQEIFIVYLKKLLVSTHIFYVHKRNSKETTFFAHHACNINRLLKV